LSSAGWKTIRAIRHSVQLAAGNRQPRNMRRFSQRGSLVTLSEINITPLLDLAFVLLIIFIITTPLLEHSIALHLPTGGKPNPKLDPKSIRTVEVNPTGGYRLDKMPMSSVQMEQELVKDHSANPSLVVAIRADKKSPWENVAQVFDICQRNGITRFNCQTEPRRK
jgi:biopolymer transport protein ExbD